MAKNIEIPKRVSSIIVSTGGTPSDDDIIKYNVNTVPLETSFTDARLTDALYEIGLIHVNGALYYDGYSHAGSTVTFAPALIAGDKVIIQRKLKP